MMSGSKHVTVRVSHRFAQKPERVFDAWLDPKTAGKWLFATPTGQITRCEIDARVGGKFSIVRHEGQDIEHTGEYLVIERPRRLVFTFGAPKFSDVITKVTVEIAADGAGSALTLIQENVPAEYEKPNIGGWTMILESLERHLSAG